MIDDLEQRLRRELHDNRHALPSWPDASTRVQANITLRRRRRRIVASAVVVAALVLGVPVALRLGLSAPAALPAGPSQTSTAPTGVVPSSDTPSTPPVTPSGSTSGPRPTAVACKAADLSTATVAPLGAAMGHSGYEVTVSNTASHRCILVDAPQLRGTDLTNGEPLVLTSNGQTYFDRAEDERPPALDPGEQAHLFIATANGCNGGADAHTYRFATLTVLGRVDRLNDLEASSSCAPAMSPWFRRAIK